MADIVMFRVFQQAIATYSGIHTDRGHYSMHDEYEPKKNQESRLVSGLLVGRRGFQIAVTRAV